jgi:hypothetical protein
MILFRFPFQIPSPLFPRRVGIYQTGRVKSQWVTDDFSAADDLVKKRLIRALAGRICAVARIGFTRAGRNFA